MGSRISLSLSPAQFTLMLPDCEAAACEVCTPHVFANAGLCSKCPVGSGAKLDQGLNKDTNQDNTEQL